MEVVLQSVLTGVTSSVLVLRKADKSMAMTVADEPVSQLHKVAFLVKGSDRQYLALVQDNVTMEKVRPLCCSHQRLKLTGVEGFHKL